jgi:hypothetical protein
MDDQNRILAGLIFSCKPEDLKAVALKADGSLAVVAPNGMKFVFSPVELDNARDSFCLPAAPLAEPAPVPHGDLCRAGIEAREHGAPNPPASTGSADGLSSVTGSSSADETPMAELVEASRNGWVVTSTSSVTGSGIRHHRKEKRL